MQTTHIASFSHHNKTQLFLSLLLNVLSHLIKSNAVCTAPSQSMMHILGKVGSMLEVSLLVCKNGVVFATDD